MTEFTKAQLEAIISMAWEIVKDEEEGKTSDFYEQIIKKAEKMLKELEL